MTDEQDLELYNLSTDFPQYSKLRKFVKKVIEGMAQVEKVDAGPFVNPYDGMTHFGAPCAYPVTPGTHKDLPLTTNDQPLISTCTSCSPTDSIIFESETYRDKIYPSERKRIRVPALIANGQEVHPERYEYLSLVCRPSEMRTD
jgi:hypothetical protein